MGVPPHELRIMPTGTPSARWMSRAKKYPTAVNSRTVLGDAGCHPDVFAVVAGSVATARSILSWRMSG